LTWNHQSGIDALEALRQIQSNSGFSRAAPPPPPPPPPATTLNAPGRVPPPPPPPPPAGISGAPAAPAPDMSAVFAELNQGDIITSSLRKVDKSEMTHKNPNLRPGETVLEHSDSLARVTLTASRRKSLAPGKKPKPESMRVKKPPKKKLEGNKWLVENFDNGGIVEIEAQQNQSILISRCNKTIVKVSNKANAVSVDNCCSLSIIIDSLVSSLDVIKSPKFALQINSVVPTLLLDQVDGATIYLSSQSLNTEVFSSKCTAVNVMLPPKEGTNDDTKECPVPEQIKSYVKGDVLVSEIIGYAG
jgi:adenylyl cyclase-associated protein